MGEGAILFQGDSDSAFLNIGSINGADGDVFLIARKVFNEGMVSSTADVGLAAMSAVLIPCLVSRMSRWSQPAPGCAGGSASMPVCDWITAISYVSRLPGQVRTSSCIWVLPSACKPQPLLHCRVIS